MFCVNHCWIKMSFSKCKFYHILHYILKFYHNFEWYQNMLTTLGFCFLYHKLQHFFLYHAHYTPFTCGKKKFENLNFLKTTLNFSNFKIPYLLKCECFLNFSSRLLSSKIFYHQNYVITIVLYLVFYQINHIWCNIYSSSNVLFKNQNPKFNLMNL
jgi:hypothetical protein